MQIALTLFLGWLLTACGTVPQPQLVPDPISKPADPAEQKERPLRITMLDVGQGDAIFVEAVGGKNLLIDAGPPGSGVAKILPLLRARGISRIDLAIATHHHLDHTGGFDEVRAGEDRVEGTDDDVPFLLLDRLECAPGILLDLGGGTEVHILAANGRFADGTGVYLKPDEENEASVALLVRNGWCDFLAAGDMTGGGALNGLLSKDLEGILGGLSEGVEILKVSHHGSNLSTRDDFLEMTGPLAALISVGDRNDYGHPHPDTIRRLLSHGVRVFQTEAGAGRPDPQVTVAHGPIDLITQGGVTWRLNSEIMKCRDR